MAYQALYRKFRPRTFEHVIGQKHIVKTLKNQIMNGRVSHAYLFCGTRGTGKTSTAKIFARAINCLTPKEGEPCNTCEMCQAIAEGRSLNVVEIDAASNNGVDNIREIREEVKYPPTEGKYKVYIIDEVHMLSTGAFNALLKTLEEPPAHVIFILATTDPQKVPATILSRCQRFDFRRISSEDIVETLKVYLAEEKVEVDERALRYVAKLGDGSMRDSLSILDQCIAFYYGERVTLEKVLDIMGSVDDSAFFQMTDAIAAKNSAKCMDMVDAIVMQGRDVGQFVEDLVSHLRNLLVVSTVSDAAAVLDVSEETMAEYKKQLEKLSGEEILFLIRTFSELMGQLKYAGNERILLEVALLKLCSPTAKESYEALAARIASLERNLQNGSFAVPVPAGPSDMSVKKEKPAKKVKPKALPEDMKEIMDVWPELKSGFDAALKGLLSKVDLGYLEEDLLYLVCDNKAIEDIILKKEEEISEKLAERMGREFTLKAVTKGEYEQKRKTLYGEEEAKEEDLEFESLMSGYFPEADFE